MGMYVHTLFMCTGRHVLCDAHRPTAPHCTAPRTQALRLHMSTVNCYTNHDAHASLLAPTVAMLTAGRPAGDTDADPLFEILCLHAVPEATADDSTPSPCEAGSGGPACTACQPGYFSTATMHSCTSCTDNNVSGTSATTCTACPENATAINEHTACGT